MSTTPLYSVNGRKGAHMIVMLRTCHVSWRPGDPLLYHDVADVRLVGEQCYFSALVKDVKPYSPADAITEEEADTITMLSQEAVLVYRLDAEMVDEAMQLARMVRGVQLASFDENGQFIKTPSLKVMIVKGLKGWHVVRPGFCTCEESQAGAICKHRVAAWMYREATIRPLAKARHCTPSLILAQLGAA